MLPSNIPILLNDRAVEKITAFLFHAGGNDDPAKLKANENKSFQGSIVLGMGFTFDDSNPDATPIAEMHRLIAENPKNAEVIFPYIGGEEVNSNPTHAHHRYVINFGEMSEEEARENYPDLMAIVEEKVKPQRTSLPPKNNWNRTVASKWWLFGADRKELKEAIEPLDRVLVTGCSATKYLGFPFLPANMVFSHKLVVFPLDKFSDFAVMKSRTHEIWATFFSATLAETLTYNPSDCFETFPFPFVLNSTDDKDNTNQPFKQSKINSNSNNPEKSDQETANNNQSLPPSDITTDKNNALNSPDSFSPLTKGGWGGSNTLTRSIKGVWEGSKSPTSISESQVESNSPTNIKDELEAIGQKYYEYRAELMVRNNEGLTDTYNRFHDPYETDTDILKLRELHEEMDKAVLKAYGWDDIDTTCGFALDYLDIEDESELPSEAQERIATGDYFFATADEAMNFDGMVRTGNRKLPWRYRWGETTHDEVLARLLELNRQRAEEEALMGVGVDSGKGKKKAPSKKKKKVSKEQGTLNLDI